MKNWIKGIITVIVIACLTFLCTSLLSCTHESGHGSKNNKEAVSRDTVSKQNSVMTFNSVVDVLKYREIEVSNFVCDSIFRNIPITTLRSVTEVLSNKSIPITKNSIVEEYRLNKTVYDNLIKQQVDGRE